MYGIVATVGILGNCALIISCCRSPSSSSPSSSPSSPTSSSSSPSSLSSSPAEGQTEIERLTWILARLLWYWDLIVMRSMPVCVLQFLHMLETATTFVAFFFLSKRFPGGMEKCGGIFTKIHVLAVSILSQNIPRPSPVWLTTRLYLVNIIQGQTGPS